ncbi:MAG: hypothetical protein JWO36_698 [Myxococcales bacterium]|nr:hypothetical protein [Myxococcales bacterium]
MLDHSTGLGGTITLSFNIAPTGDVTQVSVVNDSMRDAEVASCVARAIHTASFPTSGGGANVKYPFVFSPGG